MPLTSCSKLWRSLLYQLLRAICCIASVLRFNQIQNQGDTWRKLQTRLLSWTFDQAPRNLTHQERVRRVDVPVPALAQAGDHDRDINSQFLVSKGNSWAKYILIRIKHQKINNQNTQKPMVETRHLQNFVQVPSNSWCPVETCWTIHQHNVRRWI